MSESNHAFSFVAIGHKNGQRQSHAISVDFDRTRNMTTAKILATRAARKWADQNNLQNFYIN